MKCQALEQCFSLPFSHALPALPFKNRHIMHKHTELITFQLESQSVLCRLDQLKTPMLPLQHLQHWRVGQDVRTL